MDTFRHEDDGKRMLRLQIPGKRRKTEEEVYRCRKVGHEVGWCAGGGCRGWRWLSCYGGPYE